MRLGEFIRELYGPYLGFSLTPKRDIPYYIETPAHLQNIKDSGSLSAMNGRQAQQMSREELEAFEKRQAAGMRNKSRG